MKITASFQSFFVSALHVSVAGRPAAAASSTTTAASAVAGTDTVSLSTATAPAPPTSAQDATPDHSPETSQSSSPLFAALDADQDGAVTRDEFTSGALALLGRRGDRPHVHGNADGENGRRARGLPGLERRLEKAFDRVDANDDGNLDQREMSAALSGGDEPTTDVPLAPAASETTQAGGGVSAAFVSVTYVSVAIQRYTSLQTLEPSSPSSSPTVPSSDDGVAVVTPSAA